MENKTLNKMILDAMNPMKELGEKILNEVIYKSIPEEEWWKIPEETRAIISGLILLKILTDTKKGVS